MIKYRFDGTPLWGKALGGAGLTTNPQVEVDKASNVCVSGQFSGSINIPGYTTILSTGGFDGFVSKFNINGNFVSFTHFKGLGDCTFLRMNWDVGSNALFVTFSVSNGVTIVGGYLFNSVTGDCGIVKMTASNLVVTGLKVGSAGSIERIDDIYADQNALYVVGSFTGASTTFANQTITGGSTGINSFAARIKDDLLPTSATWAKLVTKNTTAALQPLTVAAWGNYCYVGGSHDASTQQLVGVAAPTPAGFDGFVMKFGALTAASSFVTSYSSSGSDRVTDLATNSSKLFIGAYTEPSAMMRKLQIEKYDLATGTIANSVFVSPNIAADIHTIRSVATPIAVNSYCYISGVFQTNLTNSSGSINLSQTPPHLNGFLLQDL